MKKERDNNGRFANGNPGGPGRPRRAVEQDYLAVLGDAVSLDDWRDVVARTVSDAKKGDARARDWLANYLIGSDPIQLAELAARELRGATSESFVDDVASKQANDEQWAATTKLLLGDLMTRQMPSGH